VAVGACMVAGVGTALLVAAPGSAEAAPTGSLPPSLAMFAHCPISNKSVGTCIAGSMTGTFQINSTTLTATQPAILSLGLISTSKGTTAVAPTDGTPALQSPAIPVPGGLLGIPGSSGPLAVYATPQLVALPTISIGNLLSTSGTAVQLPLQTLLTNPLLGTDCTLGDASNPMTLNLTDGTTSPPPPNKPITGSLGTLTTGAHGVLIDEGATLVDNAFAAPGADNCGPLGLLDPVVDLDKSLPSAAGMNTAVLTGTTYLVDASVIRRYLH
jgi:hypothetical protein